MTEFVTHDYVSAGLVDPRLQHLFPNMIESDRSLNNWKYLRREIPHVWRADKRSPVMGFISVDEATLLHNLALPFAGKRGVEIGCWRGWSTAHIASAGVVLNVIDPVLRDPQTFQEIQGMVSALGAGQRVTLYAGESPATIYPVAEGLDEPWSFAFIDGDHEQDAPTVDAANVVTKMAPDAAIVFHDLASPYVAAGLAYLRDKGWNTKVFQTMQIMGVAWRGDVTIPEHIPDPAVDWSLPEHLHGFAISGETEQARAERLRAAAPRLSGLAVELTTTRDAIAKIEADCAAKLADAQAWITAERDNAERWKKVALDFQALYNSELEARGAKVPAPGSSSDVNPKVASRS